MGSRLVVRAAPYLLAKPFLREADLVCPDIDAGLVKHYADRYLSADSTTIIRLYMSHRDKALAISRMIHGGYARLGQYAGSLVSIVRNGLTLPVQASGKSSQSTEQLHEPLESIKHRLQTIDFTTLDKGWLGHKIPVDLIYNMSYTDSPGTGLTLVREQSEQRLPSSRAPQEPANAQTAPLTPPDTCWRVVRLTTAFKHNQDARGNASAASSKD